MEICKEYKEVTCTGCHGTKCNKLKRKYRCLKWNIEERIRKLYKRKDNNYKTNYEEDNENWKNHNIMEVDELIRKESFNFKEEVIKDINEVIIICVSEVPNWKEYEKWRFTNNRNC
ncbi:hypothetical protein RhiirA4_487586 [Rhizophagus irregularis]|uniref:Uncharacterized protein n=1 Tax=Rhizophagus irregularis TaxID=588596 RepID=A0A2I1HSR4_9GLOM|nr:hypothetical protein RhiirA4_487586 [Rhizophagus irregularis]